jgi:hypothetical protein
MQKESSDFGEVETAKGKSHKLQSSLSRDGGHVAQGRIRFCRRGTIHVVSKVLRGDSQALRIQIRAENSSANMLRGDDETPLVCIQEHSTFVGHM